MAVRIILKNSSAEDKRPTAAQLENGEIALNYNAAGAFLTCEDTDGNIQQVGGVKISEVAPDSPVKQTLWFQPSSLTLFVYDGNSFLPIAGGGGGGTPGGGITTIIGNNGIDASEIAGVVTLDVELAGGDDGLEFSASKLKASVASASQLGSVKIGDAISVTGDGTITPRIASASQTGIVKIGDGIDVAGDGTISVDIPQTLTFRGSVDLNNPPTGQVQLPSAVGDAYVNSTNADPVNAGWAGIAGDSSLAGDLVVWDGTEWEIIGTGGNGFDDRYLRIDTAAGDQTVASTGTTTFDGEIEASGGVTINGSSPNMGASIFGVEDENYLAFTTENTKRLEIKTDGVVITAPNRANSRSLTGSATPTVSDADLTLFTAFANNGSVKIDRYIGYSSNVNNALETNETIGFEAVAQLGSAKAAKSYGFHSYLLPILAGTTPASENYNFYAAGTAPNFFAGDTYIGGSTTRNTRELWESTLTEEQKEQLAAGTLVVPANVSTPGDGEFARQWWYDQQDEEDQALIDAGELDYPERLQATNFVDTFDLGDNTVIDLLTSGPSLFKNSIETFNGNVNLYRNSAKSQGFKFDTLNNNLTILSAPGNPKTFDIVNTGEGTGIVVQSDTGIIQNWKSEGGVLSQVFGNGTIDEFTSFYNTDIGSSSTTTLASGASLAGYEAKFDATQTGLTTSPDVKTYGFYSDVKGNANNTFDFYAASASPSFFRGLTEHASGIKVTGDVNTTGNVLCNTLAASGRVQTQDGVWLQGGTQGGLPNGLWFDSSENTVKVQNTTKADSINTEAICITSNLVIEKDLDFIAGFKSTPHQGVVADEYCGFIQEDVSVSVMANNGRAYGFYSGLTEKNTDGKIAYNFYAEGDAPNFFAGQVTVADTLVLHPTSINFYARNSPDSSGITQVTSSGEFSAARNNADANIPIMWLNRTGNDSGTYIRFGDYGRSTNESDRYPVGSAIVKDGMSVKYNESSDYRLKTNINSIDTAIEKIKLLNPVTFEWINYPGTINQGFLAHELAEVCPKAVTGTKDATETYGTYTDTEGNVETNVVEPSVIPAGATFEAEGTRPVYQGVDQTKLIPLLTKALQEALEKIDTLEQRLSDAGL